MAFSDPLQHLSLPPRIPPPVVDLNEDHSLTRLLSPAPLPPLYDHSHSPSEPLLIIQKCSRASIIRPY